jgi:hypothetical protein
MPLYYLKYVEGILEYRFVKNHGMPSGMEMHYVIEFNLMTISSKWGVNFFQKNVQVYFLVRNL